MLVTRVAITEDRAVTLRSAQLPQPMAAVVVGLATPMPQRLSAEAEAASEQRVQLPVQQYNTAVVVVVAVALLLVSVP